MRAAAGPGEPEVVVLPDAESVSIEAASRIVRILAAAIDERGRADWATTGGSTPAPIYRALSEPPLRDAVDWPRVHLWWGDDRYVPRDHRDSNVLLADEILLARPPHGAGVGILVANVHPFPCSEAIAEARGAAWCAKRYAAEVRAALPEGRGGWPAFDLALVGVGPDGHLLSVFPGSAAFDSPAIALAIPAPTHVEPHVERVTLNPAILDAARHLLVVSHGAGKAAVLAGVLDGPRDERRLPAQRARRSGATWLLDIAAAANLAGR